MKFYHGSVIQGLTQLQPRQSWYSNVNEPLVYLTTSRQLALHYIWDLERIGVKMPMLHICDNGKLIFKEMFSGALAYFYKDVCGYIYHCEGDYPLNPGSGVLTCATSNTPVPVTDCEYIDDVYAHIWQYAKEGMFEYERYEDLPQWRIDVIRGHVIRFIKRNQLLQNAEHPGCRFVQEKFPQYWAEAEVLDQYSLL